MIHTARIIPTDCSSPAIDLGTMKIPAPIIVTTTTEVESSRPSLRGSSTAFAAVKHDKGEFIDASSSLITSLQPLSDNALLHRDAHRPHIPKSIAFGPAVLRRRCREASWAENSVLSEQPVGIFATLQHYAGLLPSSGKPLPDCSKRSPNPDQEQSHD